MYGVFTYIYHKNQPNVGKYNIHGPYGVNIPVIDESYGVYDAILAASLLLFGKGSSERRSHKSLHETDQTKLGFRDFVVLIYCMIGKKLRFTHFFVFGSLILIDLPTGHLATKLVFFKHTLFCKKNCTFSTLKQKPTTTQLSTTVICFFWVWGFQTVPSFTPDQPWLEAQVTSYNEWGEGTQIEPAKKHRSPKGPARWPGPWKRTCCVGWCWLERFFVFLSFRTLGLYVEEHPGLFGVLIEKLKFFFVCFVCVCVCCLGIIIVGSKWFFLCFHFEDLLGGFYSTFFMFTPNFGEDFPFLTYIFNGVQTTN